MNLIAHPIDPRVPVSILMLAWMHHVTLDARPQLQRKRSTEDGSPARTDADACAHEEPERWDGLS